VDHGSGAATDRARAEQLDADDVLSPLRDRFVLPSGGKSGDLIYLDGNSLGMLPRSSLQRLHDVVEVEWGGQLVGSWPSWIGLPMQVGDRLGTSLLGAAPGQVVVADSTSVNLFKLAWAAVDVRPGRTRIITDAGNFPTDRYVLEGVASARGLTLDLVETENLDAVADAIDEQTALVSLSHVDYRSAAVADVPELTSAAHDAGALVLWDLAHSAGVLPVALDAWNVDLAVGCTYKYLNAGPGAPAFLFVRSDLQAQLRQPIWGWFGQREQFAMGAGYDPIPGIERFQVGTPSIPGVVLVDEGVALLAEAGTNRVRAKSVALTSLLVELVDAWLAPLGFALASPRDADQRGSHVSIAHPDGYRICRALIEEGNVVPDFRAPDRIRCGLSPLTTRFVDVWDAMDRLRSLVERGVHLSYGTERASVT
jgi:kynureninase